MKRCWSCSRRRSQFTLCLAMWRCLERETASRSRSGSDSIGQRFTSFWRGVQRGQLKPPENCVTQAQCWGSPMTRKSCWIRSGGYWLRRRCDLRHIVLSFAFQAGARPVSQTEAKLEPVSVITQRLRTLSFTFHIIDVPASAEWDSMPVAKQREKNRFSIAIGNARPKLRKR
jgi:hypothetical protein